MSQGITDEKSKQIETGVNTSSEGAVGSCMVVLE